MVEEETLSILSTGSVHGRVTVIVGDDRTRRRVTDHSRDSWSSNITKSVRTVHVPSEFNNTLLS